MTEKQRAEKRRILRGLVQRSSSDILNASRARQMAGDGGEDKRFPKRPFHGEGDENASATENENVKIPPGKKTSSDARRGKEQRGKENASVLTHCRSSGSTEAKMDQTVVCGSQTRVEPGIFFDEDSNHIFPVEQFFGNMDVVQEYQRRSPGSKRMSRKEYRSQHFMPKRRVKTSSYEHHFHRQSLSYTYSVCHSLDIESDGVQQITRI